MAHRIIEKIGKESCLKITEQDLRNDVICKM